MSLVLVLILLHAVSAWAELIDGPANVRSAPNGDILFSLENDTEVDVSHYGSADNKWLFINKTALFSKLDTANLEETTPQRMRDFMAGMLTLKGTIKAGAKLIDEKYGMPVGETKSSFAVQISRSQGLMRATLTGYTYKDNLRGVIEREVERMINSKTNPLTSSSLRKHMDVYHYVHWFKKDHMDSYLAYESSYDDPSPGARVILIFYDDVLSAIIFSRDMSFKSYESKRIDRDYSMVYVEIVEKDKKDEIEDYYLNIISSAD